MTRGDSESVTVSCVDAQGEPVPFAQGDRVYLTVKRHESDADKVFQKTVDEFEDGKAVIPILPEDTQPAPFGRYVYDVQWTTAAGVVITIIKPHKFVLEGEVTHE